MENAVRASTDNDMCVVQQVPTGSLKGILVDILSEKDAEKIAAMVIGNVNEVCDAALGLPTLNGADCLTCGAKNSKFFARTSKDCEGHFGLVNLPYTILNPYYMPEVAAILNKICPGCKFVRQNKFKQIADSSSNHHHSRNCRYCTGNYRGGYPRMKFKVSSKDVFAKTAIIVEVDEKLLSKSSRRVLASDYWDVIPKDSSPEDSGLQSNRRVLLPAQVYSMLKDVCPRTLEALLRRKNIIFTNSLLVTPNSHRVTEFAGRMTLDETTRMYRRLIDFRGTPNELSARVLERYKVSKIRSEKVSTTQQAYEKQSLNDSLSSSSGLKNIKELLIGKRTDHSFRLVVVGDPRIKVYEIGLPVQIAENVLVSDHLHLWNWSKLESCCDFMINRNSKFFVTRDGQRISIGSKDMLRTGDTIQRPLMDGDIILINRPPSIHQHSLIGLSVKILSTDSVVSINPLICSPLRGDFDGDCLHGYVPQSVNSRVELKELVSLDKQLVNGQNGKNLLPFCQDSSTGAYLVLEDGVLLSRPEFHQLQMLCSDQPLPVLPAILQPTSTEDTSFWTGKQLFSQLLPPDFEFSYASGGVSIRKGEVLSSSCGSSWLRDSDENIFQSLISHCPEKVLDFLSAAQEMLCEWLHKRGLSISLSDLYLAPDQETRKTLLDDISYGLEEAERLSDISSLLVDDNQRFLIESSEEDANKLSKLKEHLYVAQQTSPQLCHASLSASKSVFRDMQNLVYQYAGHDNSFLAMLKAGSKGNLQKLFQHSMCLGLQHSVTPLSFSIPRHLSCASWNDQKSHVSLYRSDGTHIAPESYIPCTVIASSYLEGLNPLECFVHSLTTRDSSFSGQADISGTLTRRIMFFMRDLIVGYDGTVRNCYGNQVVQFSYCTKDLSDVHRDALMAGHPVGSLAACAISETAYSALDQPVSVLEPSPLIALKKVLECGMKKNTGSKSASLFLSRRLGRWANGFEFGALEVKDHLESLLFSNVVSEVMISYCISSKKSENASPWVCHFHINKEVAKRKRLKLQSIIKALHMNCKATAIKMKVNLSTLLIESKPCSEADAQNISDSKICISVAKSQDKLSDLDMESLQDLVEPDYLREVVIPVLLRTVIKGFREFKKVDILWRDGASRSKFPERCSGEPLLRVVMSDYCERTTFWSILVEKCLRVRNIIDWERSHPDDIHDYTESYGIDAAWQCFVNRLHSAISDTGKTILPEHLVVTANCLSVTGAFVPLNAKGLAQQRKEANIFSPFMQACFSSPADCLLKAAKMGQVDHLQGSVEALAWGQTPPIGTGCQFEFIYNETGHEPAKPTDVYSLLKSHIGCLKSNEKIKLPMKLKSATSVGQWQFWKANGHKSLLNRVTPHFSTVDEIHNFQRALKRMLQEYSDDYKLSGEDKYTAIRALQCHPRWKEKIGSGDIEIKVGQHPDYEESRCFFLVKTDGTEEDISYRKCIYHALKLLNHNKAKAYHSRWLSGRT